MTVCFRSMVDFFVVSVGPRYVWFRRTFSSLLSVTLPRSWETRRDRAGVVSVLCPFYSGDGLQWVVSVPVEKQTNKQTRHCSQKLKEQKSMTLRSVGSFLVRLFPVLLVSCTSLPKVVLQVVPDSDTKGRRLILWFVRETCLHVFPPSPFTKK